MRLQGNQLTRLFRQSGDQLLQNNDGTWSGEVHYVCRWRQVLFLSPRVNVGSHPDFPTLICNGCRVERMTPGDFAKLIVSYKGFTDNTLPGDQYVEEIVNGTSSEPIETHPDFVSTIGGTPDAPLNQAIFDKDGKFTGFPVGSDFAGVESYLVPTLIYRRTTPTQTRPLDFSDVGKINSPGITGPDGSNWLKTSKTWRRDGGVFSVTEEWTNSGPKGWDDTIYPS